MIRDSFCDLPTDDQLEDQGEGSEGEWDWDCSTSVSLASPRGSASYSSAASRARTASESDGDYCTAGRGSFRDCRDFRLISTSAEGFAEEGDAKRCDHDGDDARLSLFKDTVELGECVEPVQFVARKTAAKACSWVQSATLVEMQGIPEEKPLQRPIAATVSSARRGFRQNFIVPLSSEISSNSTESSLLARINDGFTHGYKPLEISEGVSNAYFLFDANGNKAAIFKPQDTLLRRSCSNISYSLSNNNDNAAEASQPTGFRKGIKFCESSIRETAAYLLDNSDLCPVTFMVKVSSFLFENNSDSEQAELMTHTTAKNGRGFFRTQSWTAKSSTFKPHSFKIGSLQLFAENECSVEDFGASMFSLDDVHKIGLFDVRLLNMDRHEGNILVTEKKQLVPIDHGLILPDFDAVDDDVMFCWLNWPQAKVKFSAAMKEEISRLDYKRDVEILKQLNKSSHVESFAKISERSFMSLKLGTILVQKGVLQYDLTLKDLGEIICGECFNGATSPLNEIINATKEQVDFDPMEWNNKEEMFLQEFGRQLDSYLCKKC